MLTQIEDTNISNLFSKIGESVLNVWRDAEFCAEDFPQIANDALEQYQLHKQLDADSLLNWIIDSQQLPEQQHVQSEFGDCKLTVYSCEHFYIEILYWLDGTTSIHQHAFSGAFSVLAGSSMQALYDFKCQHKIGQTVQIGEVVFKSIEQLKQGDVRPIYAGERTAHALFHLDFPTISIVIRSYRDSDVKQQLTYWPPNIAVDPFAKNLLLGKQCELLGIQAKLLPERYLSAFIQLSDNLDIEGHITLMLKQSIHLERLEFMSQALAHFGKRAPQLVDGLALSLRSMHISRKIIAMRQRVKQPELRFFLAVLLNAPTKRASYQLISEQYPGVDIGQLICHWLEQLALSSELSDAAISTDSLPFILCMLNTQNFAETLELLIQEFEREEIEANIDSLRESYNHFSQDSILANLFREG